MSAIIRLKCDKCGGESSLAHHATKPNYARDNERKYGWSYDFKELIATDLCPVCNGRDLTYWTAEPF